MAQRMARRAVASAEREYGIKDVCGILGRSRWTVYNYIEKGLLIPRERRTMKGPSGRPRLFFLMCDIVDCQRRL